MRIKQRRAEINFFGNWWYAQKRKYRFNPRTLNSLIELFFPNIRGSFEQYNVLNSNSFYTYINQRSFTRATFHVHLKRT